MKIKALITILFIGVFAFGMKAQTEVKGEVLDARNRKGVEGCEVMFSHNDSIAAIAVTDKKGQFTLSGLPKGMYKISVAREGFREATGNANVTGTIKMAPIMLYEEARTLDEVVVSADKNLVTKERAGMSVYYLSANAKKEKLAYSALAEIPKLIVDPVLRDLTLRDQKRPLIMVNGVVRPKALHVLDPSTIESVELVENPPARYQNVSAILNIITKKNAIRPYVRGNVSINESPKFTNGVETLSAEVGTAKSSLSFNAMDVYSNRLKSESYSDVTSSNLRRITDTKSKSTGTMLSLHLFGDRIFSSKDYLAFGANSIISPHKTTSESTGTIEKTATGEITDMTGSANSRTNYTTVNANLFYRHTFRKNHTFELTGTYHHTWDKSKAFRTEQNILYPYQSETDIRNLRHRGELKADYNITFKNNMTFQVGSHTSFAHTASDDRLDSYPDFIYRQWDEYIYAGLDNNRSKSRFNYVLSLGLDVVSSDADGIKNNYVNFIPSLSLGYRFKKGGKLSFLYRRSRQFPVVNYLNPHNLSSDIFVKNVGNPYLKPSHSDQARLSYSRSIGRLWLQASANYTYTADIILPYGEEDGDVYINTYRNIGHQNAVKAGTDLSYNMPCGNIGAGFNYTRRFIPGASYRGNEYFVNLFGNFRYRKFNFNLYGQYSTGKYSLTSKTNSVIYTRFTVSWNVIKNLNIQAGGENPVYCGHRDITWTSSPNYTSYSAYLDKGKKPYIFIGASYYFTNKVKSSRRNKKDLEVSDNGYNQM